MARSVRSIARLALFGLGLAVVGCSREGGVRLPESGATLEGTVTYGTEKVGAALVVAQSASGTATAFVDDDGRYRMENVPLGEVHIGVDTAAGKGQAIGKMMAASQGKAKGAPKIVEVPKQYADPAKSGLKTTVNKGPNTYDIVIPK